MTRTYLDPGVPMDGVDPRLSRTFSGFDPARVRDRLLGQHPFDEDHIRPFQFRPLDMRYAYVETETQLWNRARPLLVTAATAESGFLLARRRAPRALDGAALHYSDCLVDQKVLFTDAYAIPFWLSAAAGNDDKSGTLSLFGDDADQPGGTWQPNLSGKALDYLRQLGIEDAGTSKDSATLIWLHALAIGLSPLYVEQNGEAVRSDWPRIPLPASAATLRESAALGARAAALLNPHATMVGVDAAPVDPRLRTVAVIERTDGLPLNPGTGDLAVTAAWGIVQAQAIMPGAGKYDIRERPAVEGAGLAGQDREVLGEQLLDIYLNDHARWRGVPGAAWDYKIGGFQVLRKWLTYRDKRALGRDLTTVRVEVTDRSGPGVPELRPVGDDAEGGRGLGIVAGLAERWGWRRRDGRTVTWFVLRAYYGWLNTTSLETADARITTGSESGVPVGEWFCRRCPGGCCSATRKEADEDCR